MKVAGIIAEYNPLHNGHFYHIQETRRAGYNRIVVVLSPNAVQRAEPSFFSKWTRAAAAIRCGVDLVVELPTPWAVSSAARFAEAGISLLAGMGCVDAVSFGSESGNIEELSLCAEACIQVEKESRIKELLGEGRSYAAARDAAIAERYGEETAALIRKPNNILAVEYLKAIHKLNTSLKGFTIPRKGPGHDSTVFSQRMASASSLRDLIQAKGFPAAMPYIPPQAAELFRQDCLTGTGPASILALESAILYRLRTMSLEDFRSLPDVSEGLERRLYKLSRTPMSYEQLTDSARTRRYTLSRIRRIFYAAMLGLNKQSAVGAPPYLRVLAFNEDGKNLLRKIKRNSTLPVYHSFARLERDFPQLAAAERLATDLFRYACPSIQDAHSEYQDRRPYSAAKE